MIGPLYKRCRRPTKRGTPCRTIVRGMYRQACPIHETDLDRDISKKQDDAWRAGYEAGRATVLHDDRVVQLTAEVERLKSVPCQHLRTHDSRGRQLVVVTKGYTYHWDGDTPLEVGDKVLLPSGAYYGGSTWTAFVTATQSDYARSTTGILQCLSQKVLT